MQPNAAENGRNNHFETVIDVRGLQPPQNILAILKKAGEMPAGSSFDVLADSNPFQLYDLLQQHGFFLVMNPEGTGVYRGRVTPRDLPRQSH